MYQAHPDRNQAPVYSCSLVLKSLVTVRRRHVRRLVSATLLMMMVVVTLKVKNRMDTMSFSTESLSKPTSDQGRERRLILTSDRTNKGALTSDRTNKGALTSDMTNKGALTSDRTNKGALTSDRTNKGALTSDRTNKGALTSDMTNKSIHASDTATNLEPWSTLTKHDSATSRLDVEDVRGRHHFAVLGVGLMKMRDIMDVSEEIPQGRYFDMKPSSHVSDEGNVRSNMERVPAISSPRARQVSDRYWHMSSPPANAQTFKNVLSVAPLQQLLLSATIRVVESVTEQSPRLVLSVLVISRPNNVLLRQAARQTWALGSRELGVRAVFVVGRMNDWDEIVDREQHIHNDVIVVEQEENYDLLPNKVLQGMSWTLAQSITPKYIMKVDDDTIVNLPYLLHELRAGILNSSQIMGATCFNSTVIRDPRDKWAVSWLSYPLTSYPPFAFGGGYVMSQSAAASLLSARTKTSDWVHLEDVYVTGILALKSNISHVTHPAFSYWTTDKASACDFVQDKRITSVHHTEKEFYQIYSDIQVLLRARDMAECRTRSQ